MTLQQTTICQAFERRMICDLWHCRCDIPQARDEDGYLNRFEIGTLLHVLLKCSASPHIYRLEDGEKRWIRDIDTFEAERHVWEDVRFVSCGYLRGLLDGETIPPDSGPPPQP